MDYRIVFSVGLVLTTLLPSVSAGVICYSCDRLPHQRDCDTVVTCGDHEECYGERIVTDDAITYYKSGCRPKSICVDRLSEGGLILGKRSVTSCSKCCNSDYCNREICDTHVQRIGARCMSCKYALSPDFCFTSVQCGTGQVCYSQTIVHNQERRYRLGCISKQRCGVQTSTLVTPQIKKRQSLQNVYCGECCDGENCNKALCSSGTIAYQPLLQPLPLSLCRDNSSTECAHNSHRCSEDFYKYYLCPYTCGFCNGHLVDIDHCHNAPCKNNGTCQSGTHTYSCTCVKGYSGSHCEIDVDECKSSPCQNGATCHDGINSYTCTCPDGFVGTDCAIDVDECNSSPCQNGATCHDGNNSYTCTCPNGFVGQDCGTVIGDSCTDPRHFIWRNNCYYISNTPHVWTSHKTTHYDPCIEKNMKLADIDSDDEHDAVWYNVRVVNNEQRSFWLGGKYNMESKFWYWKDGSVISGNNHHWDGTSGGQHDHTYCMVMSGTRWQYRACNVPHIHLCKSVLSPNALKPTEQSNIHNGQHCEGSRYFKYNGHCYFLTLMTYGHIGTCGSNGRHMVLAAIGSDAEQIAVSHFVRNILNEPNEVWLGGLLQHGHHNKIFWRWRDGQLINMNDRKWKDSPYHSQGCMVLVGDQWGVRSCNTHYHQLCERTTISV